MSQISEKVNTSLTFSLVEKFFFSSSKELLPITNDYFNSVSVVMSCLFTYTNIRISRLKNLQLFSKISAGKSH